MNNEEFEKIMVRTQNLLDANEESRAFNFIYELLLTKKITKDEFRVLLKLFNAVHVDELYDSDIFLG